MKSWFKHFENSASGWLGFPEPLLGVDTWRVPVLSRGEGWWILFKPPGCLVAPDPRFPGMPSLTGAYEQQYREGKPEVLAWGVPRLRGVYWLDPEVCGPVLLCAPDGPLEEFRNQLGSEQYRFRFELLALDGGRPADEFTIDLPIQMEDDLEIRVSHRHGKKSQTSFRRLNRWGHMSLWEAVTPYPRPYQIRLHAHEGGLRVVGENRFGRVNQLYLSRLKRSFSPKGEREERPLWPGVAVRLANLSLPALSEEVVCPPPGPWQAALRKLDQYGYRARA